MALWREQIEGGQGQLMRQKLLKVHGTHAMLDWKKKTEKSRNSKDQHINKATDRLLTKERKIINKLYL